MKNTAYVIVDLQNDFIEGGALGVNGGERVARSITDYVEEFGHLFQALVTTQDWHLDSPEHIALWGTHCMAGTPGASLYYSLAQLLSPKDPEKRRFNDILVPIIKGLYDHGYSGFSGKVDNYYPEEVNEDISLEAVLRWRKIERLIIVGLATDHCVRATALDALDLGYEVVIFADQIAGVDTDASDAARAEIASKGGIITTSKEFVL